MYHCSIVKIICATACLGTALGLLFPVTPFFARDLGADIDTVALLFSIYSLCAMISAPFWGYLAEKIGYKKILLLGASANIISYGWMSVATSVSELFLARAVAGIFSGWMANSQAMVSELSEEAQRVSSLGLLGAAFGIGITVGPASSALLIHFATFSFSTIYLISSTLSLVALIITTSLEPLPKKETREMSSRSIAFHLPKLSLLFTALSPTITLLSLTLFLSICFTIVEGIFALWSQKIFSLTPTDVGYLLTAAGFTAVLFQGGLVGLLAKKFGKTLTFALAIFLMMMGTFFLMLSSSVIMAVIGLLCLAAGFAIFGPTQQSLLVTQNPEHRAFLLGINQSMGNFARVVGPAVGGLTFVHIGSQFPFAIGLFLTFIALFLMFLRRKS